MGRRGLGGRDHKVRCVRWPARELGRVVAEGREKGRQLRSTNISYQISTR